MMYICPVCGFNQMPFPADDHNICSCCGTEFGYHDRVRSHHVLREAWMSKGCPWFSTALRPSAEWNPFVQMLNAGLIDITVGSAGNPTMIIGPQFPPPECRAVGSAALV